MTVLLEPAGSAPTTLKDSSVTDAKLDTLAPQSMETADLVTVVEVAPHLRTVTRLRVSVIVVHATLDIGVNNARLAMVMSLEDAHSAAAV